MAGGMHGRGHLWQGGVSGRGACMAGGGVRARGHACRRSVVQERKPLKQVVRILLECILVNFIAAS